VAGWQSSASRWSRSARTARFLGTVRRSSRPGSRSSPPHDLRGAFQTFGHLLLLLITAALTWFFFSRGSGSASPWPCSPTAPPTRSCGAGHARAGARHGLQTPVAHDLFVRFYSLIFFLVQLHDYKMSHTYHHSTPCTRGATGRSCCRPTVAAPPLPAAVVHPQRGWRAEGAVLLRSSLAGVDGEAAFTGRFSKEWLEAVYRDQPEAPEAVHPLGPADAGLHAALVAVSVVFGLWPLILVVSLAPFIANWLRYFVGVPMHTACGTTGRLPPVRSLDHPGPVQPVPLLGA